MSVILPPVLGFVTVIVAVPDTDPLVALTVNVPAVVAENNPLELILPPPVTDQVTEAVIAFPDWSLGAAENCLVCPVVILPLAGVTVILVSTGVLVPHTLISVQAEVQASPVPGS